MKKIIAISSIATAALVLSLTTMTTNQSKKSIKKNGMRLSEVRIGLNKALAATPQSHHQTVYDAAKREVNTEVKNVIDQINKLLAGAKITSCDNVPAVSTTAFYTSTDGDLYSSTVGSHSFAISSVSGVTFTKKLELKLTGTSTTVGVLYADCNTGAMEVRYKGRAAGDDTDLLIAYYENETTGLESILMFSDYDANGYNAAKVAVHYVEGASSQSITYGYAESSSTGYRGTFTANTSGQVTDAVDTDVTSGTAKTDLQALTGLTTGFTVSGIFGHTVSL